MEFGQESAQEKGRMQSLKLQVWFTEPQIGTVNGEEFCTTVELSFPGGIFGVYFLFLLEFK